MNVISIVVGIILLVHGIGHIMGFLASWTNLPMGFTDRPWIFSGGIHMKSVVGKVFGLLWLVAMIGFIASAIGIFTNQSWWPTTAVAASVVSLVAIVPWWNTVTPGSRVGAVIVDVITLVALLGPWKESIIDRIG
ncbi:MAG: hypothetical protein GTO18_19060 [Anaerolineales bacterium]|nr:hypothetical protein [Anaerolineales bacterium]